MSKSRENSGGTSPVFLKIRLAALEKAITEIRHKRIDLERRMDEGRMDNEEYQRSVVQLITEGTFIKSEHQQISSRLGI